MINSTPFSWVEMERRFAQNEPTSMDIATQEKKILKRKYVRKTNNPAECAKKQDISLVFGTVINPGHVEITLPLRTLSPNQSEPWRKRHAREKEQKRAVKFAMIPIKEKLIPQLVGKIVQLKFTRYASKFLDAHDNLPMSVKKILDQTCAEIINDFVPGRADGNKCFKFEYDQVKSKVYGVKIEIKYGT